jgi:hypothetical protein
MRIEYIHLYMNRRYNKCTKYTKSYVNSNITVYKALKLICLFTFVLTSFTACSDLPSLCYAYCSNLL